MLNEHEQRRERQRHPSMLLEATVADPPLEDVTSFMRVELDSSPGVIHVCPWQSGTMLDPTPGDAAAVMESDAGNFWVVCWWPQ